MFDKLFDFLNNLISPVTQLIDDANTSEEERLELKKQMYQIQSQVQMKFAELQLEAAKLQTDLMKHETEKGNWLQKSWRPITMLVFLGLLLAESFGLLAHSLPDWVGTLFQIGFGSYIIGRSGEKMLPNIFKGEKKGEKK